VDELLPVGGLISMRRLGAALTAQRAARDLSVTGLARQSEGWWRPDELIDIEKGALVLCDREVVAVCRLYGLSGRDVLPADTAELVLDRSGSFDLTDATGVEPQGYVDVVLARVAALATIIGFSAGARDRDLGVLSESLTLSAETVADQLDRQMVAHRDEVDRQVESLSSRMVVPAIGVLVAETSAGSLLVVERSSRSSHGTKQFPAAAPLRRYAAAVFAV
jgi:hypothetical protein